ALRPRRRRRHREDAGVEAVGVGPEEAAEPFAQQRRQDGGERDQGEDRRHPAADQEDPLAQAAAEARRCGGGCDAGCGHRVCWRPISIRASASTAKVMMKSTRPSEISAAMCSSPVASVNSLAMVEAIVEPGENSEVGKPWALPITKVTAIVSPSARPSPSITAPIAP